jgi:murein peptide amidase A
MNGESEFARWLTPTLTENSNPTTAAMRETGLKSSRLASEELAHATRTQHIIEAAALPSLRTLLHPLAESDNLLVKPVASVETLRYRIRLPRYLFIGPKGGDDPIRIGIFAGIHGDEPAGSYAAVSLLQLLERNPEIATGYWLYVYPVCNPTGFEQQTRCSARGFDLNREFWNNSDEPEVRCLETELWTHAFDGIISLHSDDTSTGMYGFVRGATLSSHLLEPALKAAEQVLPRNRDKLIDGFPASNGLIRHCYHGVLTAPPRIKPKPFELLLETPALAPLLHQQQALVLAMSTILTEYRHLMGYAPNL